MNKMKERENEIRTNERVNKGKNERMCERTNALNHVKAWLISSTDHWKDKTVFGLKQRCFYPRGSQKLTTNKIWYP